MRSRVPQHGRTTPRHPGSTAKPPEPQRRARKGTSGGAASPEVDSLYLRFYQKIDGHDDITGSHHNGRSISAHYQGTGQRADVANHFLAAYES